MNILGVVFLYHPDIPKVISNIGKYIDNISKLIVWNNTPDVVEIDIRNVFCRTSFYDKLLFWGNEGNVGLAHPINEAIKHAIGNHYDALLTMDQDTIWTNFDYYINEIGKYGLNGSIFTPSINNNQTNILDAIIIRDTPSINSGTLYSIESLQKVGLMNEVFFTEGMDNEYYFRAVREGVDIYLVPNAIILQNIDDVDYYRFPIKIVACRFSAKRLYGITFGIRYIMREFQDDKRIQDYYKWWIRHHYGIKLIMKILLFEKDKFNKLYMYFKGIVDANNAELN